MEYFDILDKNGVWTGDKRSRTEVHHKGLWHRGIHLWIINHNDDILIQKRHPDKDFYPGVWDLSVAGHVTAGDTSRQTVVKETREELGLELEASEFTFLFTSIQTVQQGDIINNEFTDVYILRRTPELNSLKLQKNEVTDIVWISKKKFRNCVLNQCTDFFPHEEEYKEVLYLLDTKQI